MSPNCVERHFAFFSQPTVCAFGAAPDAIVTLLHLIDHLSVGAEDAHFEIAAAVALCAEASSGPVGASQVDEAGIYHHRLQVYARADAHFDAARDEIGLRIEASAKRP